MDSKLYQQLHKKIPRDTLDNIFMTLQDVMIMTIEQGGDNTCKLGHRSKGTKKETPALPHLVCPQEVVEKGQHVMGGPCIHTPVPVGPLLRTDEAEESIMAIMGV